jgi:hypothetical protein
MDESVVEHFIELDDASRLLLRAADLMERDGFAQHCYTPGPNGERCAGLAMVAVWGGGDEDAHEEALRRLRRVVGRYIHVWNDAPGRTGAEVIAKLRAVALGG